MYGDGPVVAAEIFVTVAEISSVKAGCVSGAGPAGVELVWTGTGTALLLQAPIE